MALAPTKYSERPAAGTLDGTEILAVSQVVSSALTSVKTTLSAIGAYVKTLLGSMASVDDAPSDGKTYGRLNAGWAEAAGGGGGITAMNEQAGTSYALVVGDATKAVRCTNGAAVMLTIPPNSTAAIPVLSTIPIFQGGAGVVTLTAGSGVTFESPNGVTTAGIGDFRTAFQRAPDVWVIG